MIHSELIMTTALNDAFHKFVDQIVGINPASEMQGKKKPRSKMAYPLAYFKIFTDPSSVEVTNIQALLGMLHFGMLSAGPEFDIAEVTGWPTGLRCLQGQSSRRGITGIIFTGNGEEWATAIRNAGNAPVPISEWGLSCYQQFAKHDLAEIIGTARPNRGSGGGYYLDFA